MGYAHIYILDKQRVLAPGHQVWNDLHCLCRIGMECYLLNNNNNNNNNNNSNNDDDDDDDDDDDHDNLMRWWW